MREEAVAAGVTLGSSCSRLLLTQATRNPLPITHSLAPRPHVILVPEGPPPWASLGQTL